MSEQSKTPRRNFLAGLGGRRWRRRRQIGSRVSYHCSLQCINYAGT